MADGKISVDVDKLLNERKSNGKSEGNNGKRPMSIEELRQINLEDSYADMWRNKGKMSYEDVLKAQAIEDMRWERRMRLQQQTGPQQPPIDVEAIIAKATEPFKQQIEEMKRQQEKAEQDRKFEALQSKIDLLINGGMKKDDPILEELKSMRQQLADEKEKAAKKEMDAFRESLRDDIASLHSELDYLRRDPGANKSEIQKILEVEKQKKELLDALGVRGDNKDEEAGLNDILDTVNKQGPQLAKTFSTFRDVLKGNDELPDDTLDDVGLPTNLPERAKPRVNRSLIPEDITEFLDRGQDTEEGFIDVSGVKWTNKVTGVPIRRADLEDLAITDPEQFRGLIDDTYKDMEARRKQKRNNPEPKEEPEPVQAPPVEEPEIPAEAKEQRNDNEDTEQQTATSEEETEPDYLKLSMDYINSGEDKEDSQGVKQWVGLGSEVYSDDADKPMTKADLIMEAQADPEKFYKEVQGHIKNLGE